VASTPFTYGGTATTGLIAVVENPLPWTGTPSFQDSFSRTASSVVGNSWQDVNGKYLLKGGFLRTVPTLYSPSLPAPLLRYTSLRSSSQSVQIPAVLWNASDMHNTSYSMQAAWGLVSRYQPNGDCYYVNLVSVRNVPTDNNPGGNGSLTLEVGCIVNGHRFTLAFDDAYFLPPAPGHAYLLQLNTVGQSPTQITASLYDSTTQQVLITESCQNDQISLQPPGRVGIMASYDSNTFGTYTLAY
jgi:hypothetical protein